MDIQTKYIKKKKKNKSYGVMSVPILFKYCHFPICRYLPSTSSTQYDIYTLIEAK